MEFLEKPKVSVVMTVQNMEQFITDALSSVLQERHIPLEVILVDNGCTDSTIRRAQEIGDSRLRIVQGPGSSAAGGLNAGYSFVRGDIVMLCDGDDLYPSQRIKEQVEWLDQHPEFGAVCGTFSLIDEKGRLVFDRYYQSNVAEEITEILRSRYTVGLTCSYAIRTEVIRMMGGTREYFGNYEDIDFLLRLGEFCRVYYLPKVHYLYRLHNSSVISTGRKAKEEFFHNLAFEFQRQRLARGKDDLELGNPPIVPEFTDETVKHVDDLDDRILGGLLGYAWLNHQAGHKWQSIRFGIRALMRQPGNLTVWRNLLALIVKRPAGKGAFSVSYEPKDVDKYFSPILPTSEADPVAQDCSKRD